MSRGGRAELPIPATTPPAARALAEYLRRLKAAVGKDNQDLAAELASLAAQPGARVRGYSEATLTRAASGHQVPTREVVEAYAAVCGGDVGRAVALWKAARLEQHPAAVEQRQPRRIRARAALYWQLQRIHATAGHPPPRTLQALADAEGHTLHPSTLRAISTGKPIDPAQLAAFLAACEIPQREVPDWLEAHQRVDAPPSPARWAGLCPDANPAVHAALERRERRERHEEIKRLTGQAPDTDDDWAYDHPTRYDPWDDLDDDQLDAWQREAEQDQQDNPGGDLATRLRALADRYHGTTTT